MIMRTAALLLALAAVALRAETELSGNIAGMTFSSDGNPHIVTDNMTVAAGGKAVIEEGCVFLFKEFTGLVVDGSLIVEGTLDSPVVFTTIHDTAYAKDSPRLPNPFDWNGVLITPRAGDVKLSNFVLAFSVYGVKSQKESFVINNGTFKQNGQFHVTVSDEIKPVVDGMPYTYNSEPAVLPTPLPPPQPAAAVARSGKALPLALIGVGVVAGGLTAWPLADWSATNEAYANERSVAAQEELKSDARTDIISACVLGGVSLTAIPIGIVTYVRRKRQSDQAARVSVEPVIGPLANGARISITM
ncbi:MAG: hypothetical protein GF331_11150 [Chitinivibrionales bacterium]|nr:hypothetical protein [Chitinivibrionales bacterium]